MTVMIVDDSLADRQHLANILSEIGYEIMLAVDGREALEKALEMPPEIIFMDIMMPVLDGIAAARELARHRATRDVPVIFVTSKAAKTDQLWGKLLGCKGYIVKPYETRQIIEQLDRAMTQCLLAGAEQ